ncbi:Hsp70 family protein [Streptomyces sp. NBC_00286]|uniref:Hsp70 family protein n=1 Tax=Streptomyces sp. NBC_00286 TaxID=2975701 RepID=UPI002E29B813|nr:Hsp70 family protein [Streptomyces sp. NBC_00286]
MTFGIDFGTSNSVVAHSDGVNTETVPIDNDSIPAQWRQPEFEELFPSVLAVRDLQRTLCFGWAAKTAPGEPVDAVKRMLGTRSAGAEQVDPGAPLLEEHHVWLGGEPFRSTAAAASLFAQMKTAAQRSFLDLREAVVTVPANATGGARYRTRAAARLAGIKVKALLNEPTAAAVSYANDIDIPGRFLIFDWGGGTIDVTVLHYDGKYFEELSSRGIAALGGLEFDEALARIFLGKLGQVPEQLSTEERNRWRRDVELTKIALSRTDAAEVPFDLPALGRTLTVSREEYLAAVSPLIERAMEPLEQCLDDTGIAPDGIDTVLMIGGTSQIPEARESVGRILGADRIVPAALCHPMTAVARGAAIYSAALDDPDQRDRFSLVTNYDLGTAFDAGPRKGFQPIIRRNRTLIARGERRFTPSRPNAISVNVEIIEGEAGYLADSDRAFPLSCLEVRLPKPERDPERNAVLVQFRYDHSGILGVKVTHEATKRLLFDSEIDSFGKDGTPLQAGLDGELVRLLSHTDVPFLDVGVLTNDGDVGRGVQVGETPPAPSPDLDSDLSVNGVAQQRL